jgi:hypothetical protein
MRTGRGGTAVQVGVAGYRRGGNDVHVDVDAEVVDRSTARTGDADELERG